MSAEVNKKVIASQKSKEKIVKTTLQLLLKKGSTSAVSTVDICNAAKITRPTLYYHFKSKNLLLAELHRRFLGEVEFIIDEAIQIEDTMERFSFMIKGFTKHICDHPELRIIIHDALIIKDKQFKLVRDKWKNYYYLLRDTITKLKLEKKINTDVKPSWIALFTLGMITWITYWFDFSRQGETNEIEEAILQLVLDGINGIKNEFVPEGFDLNRNMATKV